MYVCVCVCVLKSQQNALVIIQLNDALAQLQTQEFRIPDFLVFHTPLCGDLQTKANMFCTMRTSFN